MHLNLQAESDTFDKKLRIKDCIQLLDTSSAILCLKMKVTLRENLAKKEHECPELLEALFDLTKESKYIALAYIASLGLGDDESRRNRIYELNQKFVAIEIGEEIRHAVDQFLSKKFLETSSFVSAIASLSSFGNDIGFTGEKIANICGAAILEHNLLVIAASYSKIYTSKLDLLCQRTKADVIETLHRLILSGKIMGLINAKDEYVEFFHSPKTAKTSIETIEHCRHLIRKELAAKDI